ncbi:MAG TPA: acyltransferase [Hyphomonadaceae bacterium]|nr:acyltransferase [Hyphomonadaceae bacterium]
MGLLRVALAFAVLLSHLPPATFKFISGGTAVQGFFVVSGFYMALVLDGKYKDTGLFYTNRLLRLLPAYFVMMAIAAVALFGFNASATASREMFFDVYGHPATAIAMGLENLGLVGQDLLYWFRLPGDGVIQFDPTGAPPTDESPVAWQALLVPQSWSLSLEIMFYALAPFLARLRWGWLAAICAGSIGLRLAGYLLPVDFGLWQGRFFPTALFLFLLGMLAQRALPLAERAPKWAGFAACALALAMVAFLPMTKINGEIGRWLIYFGIAATTPFIFTAFRNQTWDRWIGDLSYPIYLSHLIVIGVVLTFNLPLPVWTAIGGTLALSIALYLAVDRPVDRWRQVRAKQQNTPAPMEAVQPA